MLRCLIRQILTPEELKELYWLHQGPERQMLLRFRVTNHASVRDEHELSMVALDNHPDLAVHPAGKTGVKTLPVVAIYGPNASGKSNILDALAFMRFMVRESHQRWRPAERIPRRAFQFDPIAQERPSGYAVDVVLDGVYYEYGFEIDDRVVLREWLYSYPENRRRLLFARQGSDDIDFGPSLTGQRKLVANLVRPNSLYLSAAAANNQPLLTDLYRWFALGCVPVKAGDHPDPYWTIHEWRFHDREALRKLLIYADVGAVGLAIQEVPDRAGGPQPDQHVAPDVDELADGIQSLQIEMLHQVRDDVIGLPIDQESAGTRAWLHLLGPVLSVLRSGGLLIVDELDVFLHPLLTAQLVQIFQDPSTNNTGAQMMFNTHNVTLLSTSNAWRLRRDEVWLTEKADDGATRLFPLTEYRVRDGLENVERRYLNGRYGAVPFFDEQFLPDFTTSSETA